MSTSTDTAQSKHRNATRFFWAVLVGATIISLAGNVVHAVLPYVSTVAVQIAAAAVPPLVLLAAVHGIALAVRAGASGTTYRCAVGAVTIIGIGAFLVSFVALRDLMMAIGYSAWVAWIFPLIVDTAVAVSTVMLVALGDKPQRRGRSPKPNALPPVQPLSDGYSHARSAKTQVARTAPVHAMQDKVNVAVQINASTEDAERAAMLVATKVTTQPVDTVMAVLAAHRKGESINASAKGAGINYRTAQRIVNGASEMSERHAVAC